MKHKEMKHRNNCLIGLLVLLSIVSIVGADSIYYAQNYANDATESQGFNYCGGYEHIRSRDTSDIDTQLTVRTETDGLRMYNGLDVVNTATGMTMYHTNNFTGNVYGPNNNWRKTVYTSNWNGSSWSTPAVSLNIADDTQGQIASVNVNDFNGDGTLEMYHTYNGMGVNNSYIYHRTYNDTTLTWDNATVVVDASDNKAQQLLGVYCGDIDGDGNQDMFYTSWYGQGNSSNVRHKEYINGEWVSQSNLRVSGTIFTDVTVGDTDGDGKLEVIYSASIYGQGYSYVYSQEWNGTGFDSAVTLFRDTNGYHDYNGVAMAHDIVPEPATLGLLAFGGLVLGLKRRKNA